MAHVLTLPNITTVQWSTALDDLGILLDSQLTMADHVALWLHSADPGSFDYIT